jgi:phospholipase C
LAASNWIEDDEVQNRSLKKFLVGLIGFSFLLLSPRTLFAQRSPIRHLVFVIMENHTFDNFFGTFPNANGVTFANLSDGETPALVHDTESSAAGLGSESFVEGRRHSN